MRNANRWLMRQPLWRFILIEFIGNSLLWSLVPYAAAWTSGGWHITSDDFGFQDGHLSIPFIVIGAAMVTAIVTVDQQRRRRREPR